MARHYGFLGRITTIALVSTKVLSRFILGWETLNHNLVQCRFQEFHVVNLSAAGDYRQRDSTRVY